MARAISYFVFSSTGSYLRWDDDTTIDFRIRQYEMSITGGGGVDRLYVGAGTKVDAGALFASANTDELYLSGNFSDYTQMISAGGVYTFTGLAGGSHANEVVSFSMNSNGDKLVFANGHITVKSSDYLSVSGSYSSILAGSLTLLAQTDPVIGAQAGNKPAKVFVFDAGGINIPQLPIVNEAINVSGGGGIDKFYVRKGTNADAIGLFASAGQDVLYLTGAFSDYSQTVSTGGVYTLTRNFTDAADASLTEVVSFSMNSSGDQLVFADGGVTLRLADYLTGGTYADITAGQLNGGITTPGLLATPTPNLILVSDTGSSTSDRITNNATINVTGLVTGGTWQYQMDGTAGSWTTGTASSLIASSGAHTYFVRQFDMAGLSSGVSTAVTYTLDTSAPSALGSVATTANVAENSRGEVTLTANANDVPASTSVTWSLGTGLDSALFDITSAGVLSFKIAPNYETPRGSAFNAASNNDAYTVNVIATDAAGNASAPSAIVVNVTDVNEAPTVVAQTPTSSVSVNQAVNLNVANAFGDPDTQATDATWRTLSYTATGLPSGLSINASTGVIGGTATATTASAASVTVTATDGLGLSITETFSLSVVSAPVISSFTVTDNVAPNSVGKSGDNLTFVVTLSEAVTVIPATGAGAVAPQITFSVNGQAVTATYASGSGTSVLTFSGGTVPATGNGTAISITSIALNSGTVTGISSGQGWVSTTVSQSYNGYTVDNTALAPNLTLASDTGSSASDKLTNNLTINVGGLEIGATWQYQVDTTAGSWVTGTASSFTASAGAHSYWVRQTDAAGNTIDTSTAVSYTLDTSAPATPSLTLASDTGSSASDKLTNNLTINVGGLEIGAMWQYQVDNGTWTTATASGTSATFTAMSGPHSYVVQQTDAAGNTSEISTAVTYTFDTSAPTTPSLTLASDTSISASDSLTSNATINVSGLETGTTWQYQVDNGTTWLTGTASSFTASEGTHSYSVRQTDAAGNTSTQSVAVIYTLDTSAVAPTLSLAADTGPNSTDGLTNNPTIVVTGLESGAVWQYKVDSTGTWTTATASGTSATFTAMSGPHSYVVQQSDVAGNTSTPNTPVIYTYTLYTNAPTTPTLTLASDTGISASDNLTSNATINVSALETGTTWQYQVDNGTWATGTASSFTASSGEHTYLVRQIDAAGNTSTTSSATYTFDTSATATPTLTLASDTGSSASDRITNNATINVTGLVTGGTWQYQVDSSAWATGTASSLIASSGAHTYFVRQTDAMGNTSTQIVAVIYTLDTSAVAPTLSLAADTGPNSTDGLTNNPTIVVTGLESGAVWQYQVDSTGTWTTATASGTSATFTAMSGSHSYVVQQSDVAGNTSPVSTAVTFNLDTSSPNMIVAGGDGSIAAGDLGAVTFTADARDVGSETGTNSDAPAANAPASANLTWALGSGADTALFDLNNGVLRFKTPPNLLTPRGAPFDANANPNTYIVYVIATDAAGNESEPTAVAITVSNINSPPRATASIASQTDEQAVLTDQAVNLDISGAFTDANTGSTEHPLWGALTYTAPGLPEGLRLNATTGVISGIGQRTENAVLVTVTATDGGGLSATTSFAMEVAEPSILEGTFYAGPVNKNVILSVRAVNLNGVPIKDKNGNVITAPINSDGSYRLNLGNNVGTKVGEREGVLTVQVVDNNGPAGDYHDEATGTIKSAGNNFSATVVVGKGFKQSAHINALSSIASKIILRSNVARLSAEQEHDTIVNGGNDFAAIPAAVVTPVTKGFLNQVNLQVGKSFLNIANADVTKIRPTPTILVTEENGVTTIAANTPPPNADTNPQVLVGRILTVLSAAEQLPKGKLLLSNVYAKLTQKATATSSTPAQGLAAEADSVNFLTALAAVAAIDDASADSELNAALQDLYVQAGARLIAATDGGVTTGLSIADVDTVLQTITPASVLILADKDVILKNNGALGTATVRFKFANAPSQDSFSADDLIVTGGTLSNFQWDVTTGTLCTATFTPAPGTSATEATITLSSTASIDFGGIDGLPVTYSVGDANYQLTSNSAGFKFALGIPAPGLELDQDSGVSATDNLTNNNQAHVFGLVGGTGNSWQYQVDGSSWINGGSGNSFILSSGVHTYTVRQINGSETATASESLVYTLDTTPPAPATLRLASDTGVSASDSLTNNPSVLVSGLESGASWQYQVDSTVGLWLTGAGTSFTASSGVHSYFVRQVDTAGNDGVISTAFVYTLDSNLPGLPVLSLASDTGINASDGITNNATIDVSGLESAATWSYRVDGGIWLEGTGTRFIASSGAHSYFVRQTDAAGNLGISSNAVFYTLDTTPPTGTMTLNTQTQIADDNTVSANEAYAGVIMEGTATANGIVTLTLGRITKTALADAGGVWSVTVEASDWGRVGRGTYTLSGALTDLAGNVSTSAATATLTVANDVPLREIVLTTIAAGTGGFAITGETAGDASGYSVSVAGDVNGDGLADVILGAPKYDAGAGRSYVVFGKANSSAVNLSAVAAAGTDGFVIHGEAAGDASGYSVSAAGDVNGDGLADVIVGAYQNDASGNNAGRAYLVFGKTNTSAVHLSAVAAGSGGFAFGGETVDDFSGRSVSAAGDVNGDGLGDLLVGAPHSYDNSSFANASPAGKSYLLFGKSNWSGVSTLSLSAVAQGSGGFVLNGENGASGSALGSLGDINGDGYADFIVGASYAGPFWAGKSYVVFGKANWSGTSAVNLADVAAGTGGFALTGSELLELSAHSVAAVGDVNGDGYADFLLGSLMSFRMGRSYLVFGRANWTDVGTLSLSTIAAGSGGFVVLGEDNLDSSGNVAAAGDVNGDGLADFIIGAPGSYGLPYTGKSYVVFGKANSSAINLHDVAAGTGGFVVTGEANYDSSGASVSAAGDINGDGLADLLVGAFNNDAGGSNAGRSYVIFGGTQWIANTVQGSGAVTGTSASEAIIGSSGADTLTGNGGIDRFFAGAGNDTIALTSSDIAKLISTTPTAVTGGHVLATIDGGAGIDSIQLFGGANLDLSAISNSSGINPKTKSRIASIERIDLASDSAANSVTVSVGDVVDMAGFNLFNTTKGWTVSATGTVTDFGASTPYHQLLIDGTATDGIVLTSSEWIRQSGTVTGNVSGISQSYSVYVNSAKNAMLLVGSVIQRIPPPPVLRLASDTGISASDGISNNATITVIGLEAGATWQYRVDQGNWQSGAGTKFNASAGQHSYSVRQVNAGITSAASTAVTFSLDTSPPSAPSIVTPIPSDYTVNASAVKAGVTIQGQAEANASVTLKLSRISKTVFANASGDWLVTLNAADWGRIEAGTYDLTVEQTDVAGNGSNLATATVTVENDAPLREILLNNIAAGTGGFAISVGATEDGTQPQEAGDRSGWSVSAAGDVNGDGWADVLIGAPESEAGGYAAGRGYVVFGKADGAEVNVRDVAAGSGGFVLTGETAVDQSGFSISAAGDVNGDGLADLFVGAPARLSGRAGRSYVVFGKTNTSAVNLSAVAAGSGGFVISGEAAGDESGISVAALGDVNGDGLADLLIGARYNGAGGINAGRSYVVFGKTNTSVVNLSAVAAGTGGFAMTGEAASDYSGSAVSAAGDVNGDGLADLLVGAPYNDAGGTNAGRSYVIFGKANTSAVSLSAVAAGTGGFAMTGEIRGDQSGISVAAAGDVNGDGLADVLVGALYNDAGGGNAGRSYVVFGKANTKAINLSAVVAGTGGFAITGEAGGDQSGFSVSAAGDMNGDGLADLLVGAPNNDVGGGNAGRSYVIFGKANTSAVHLSAVAAGSGGFAITGEIVGDQSGFSVSAAGDVNGDGLSDLLVGAPYSDVGGTGAGRSYVVFGGTQWLTRSVQGTGTVNGTVNGEAIIGSSGADILTGNGGIDRFFAGAGDDTIMLTASDIANLASNTPSNNTLATLDGGLGLDSVRLTGGANLDLTAIKISNALNSKTLSRIAGVERIDLATDNTVNILTLSVDDVRELQGFNLFNTNNGWTLNGAVTGFGTSTPYHQLVVDGTASDGIVLTSSEWVRQTGTVTGNVSGANQSYSVYVNTSKNAMLLVDSDVRRIPLPPLLRLASDTGISASDNITNNATITVSGLEDGASWRYRVDGGSWLAGAGTSFIATSGQHSYVVQQTDSVNNTSFASTAVTYTLTTTRLNPPTISAPIAGDNTVSASEAAAGVAVQGTAEANASLIVTLGGISKTVTANASGAWNTTFIASDWQRMGRGVHILTVATTQTDVAGNLGVATLSVTNEVTLGEILLSNIAAGTGGFAITGEAVDDGSGGSVTAVGDVNGDGLMDVLVSAYGNDAGGANTGRSYVVFGKANSSTIHLSAVAAGTGGFAITGEGSGDWPSAFSVAAIGDMNGDGLSDVLIGVALQDAGGYDAGRSYVVFGKTNTSAVSLSAVAAGTGGFAMTGETSHDQSGYSVSGAGDVNGDGLADVIVGAIYNDAVNYDAGRSYVVFGKANTNSLNLSSVAAGTGGFAITGRGYINESGASVSGAGDVNGDGLADLLVGARYNPAGGSYARNSYVVFGKITTNDVNLDSVAAGTGGFAITGEIFSNAYSGWKVAAAGDVNGDGLSDVLVSLPWHDAGGVDAGRSYVVFGKANGATVNINDIVAGTGGFAITGETAGDYSGSSLAAAGDVNGDGLSDVLVSAPNNGGNTGRSYVVYGKTNTSAVSLSAVVVGSGGFAIKGEAAGDQSGTIVSAAGDINGDGLADLLVGAPNNDAGGNNAGRSYVIFGGTQWVSSTVQGNGTVNGTAADEAIIGSSGADTLTGGGGVDRFFAGAGNDVIVLTASDIANLTSNTPAALAGGSALASVDGGTGIDTIRLTGGASLDLTAIANIAIVAPTVKSRIASIERIDLASDSAANSLNLRVGDVIDMTGFNLFNTSNGWTVSGAVTGFGTSTPYHQLVVDGTVADGIALVTSEWVRQTGTVTGSVSGASQSYTVYVNTSKNAMLLVDSDVRRIPLPPLLQLASDTGISASDNITNNATILVFGLESGASWRYQVDSGAWANGTGSSFNASTGAHSYSVQQVSAGNTSIASAAVAYTLDTTPPTAPTITMPIAGDNAISASEATAGVTITGTAEANTSVTLTLYQVGKTVTANASGAWTATFDATDWGRVGRGTHTLTATTTDIAGNVGMTTATLTVANEVPLREIVLGNIAAGRSGFAINGEAAGHASGYSVSAAGDVNGDGLADVIVGATGAGNDAGRSYVVFGKTDGNVLNLSAVAAGTGGFVINGEMAGDYSGFSVATVGDINGDGLADVLIGAYSNDTRGADAGRSYVVFGKTNTSAVNLSAVAAGTGGFAITGEAGGDQSGFSVSAAGDVNGDGYADFIIGAPWNDVGRTDAGRSYVVFGKTNTSVVSLSAVAAGTGGFAMTGEAASDYSGGAVSAAGDVNGDGLADLLVGAPYNDAGGTNAGRSYVIFGKANTSAVSLSAVAAGTGGFAITGEAANDQQSDLSVSAAGDVNGDGLADLLVGASRNDAGGRSAGRSYVIFGKSSTTAVNLSTVAAGTGGFAITGEAADQSGSSVSAAGDVNGDGLADLLVGAPYNAGGSRAGRSYVVYGTTNTSAVNLSAVAMGTGGFAITGEVTWDASGYSVSAAGDVNGDGLADLLVGAPYNDAGGSNAGRSYVIFGGTQWISTTVQGSGMVTGTSANEAIIGSSGVDTLTGGGGVDRFFAGAGNDVIVLTQSDISNLASNTPTAVTGGSVLSTVDGGTGIDTIRLTGGANLDLTTIKNTSGMNPKTTSRIASIERIDLATDTSANTLALAVGDVLDMAGFNLFNTGNGWTNTVGTALSASVAKHQLLIDGTATDSVRIKNFLTAWTRSQTVSGTNDTVSRIENGATRTYHVYNSVSGNAQLLIDSRITPTATPPEVASFSVSDTVVANGAQLGKSGEALVFVVTMSEAVTVTPATGAGAVAPQITFSVNGQSVTSTYSAGTGTNTLTFTGGTVPEMGNGNAVTLNTINLNGGTVVGNLSALAWATTVVGQAYTGYTVDNTALAPSLTLASDTGISASDNLTSNATINVSGLESGATWQYQVDNGTTWLTGTASSFTASEGTHSYSVRQTDAAGNTNTISTVVTYTLDTTSSVAPTLVLASDTGASSSDNTTTNPTVLVTGLESGATWQYQVDGTAGIWTAGTASSFTASNGVHSYFVRQTDTAGNTSTISTSSYTLLGTPTLRLASDTGTSPTDGITNNATITVLGLLSGASWQYQVDSTAGAWTAGTASSFTASSGGYTYFVRQFDNAGNTSIASAAVAYTLDTSVVAPTLVLASDTGASSSDNTTTNPTVLVTGLESGATWQYQVDGTAGIWTAGTVSSFTASTGVHSYFVRQTDTAGNTSTISTRSYTLLGIPTLVLASDTGTSPTDGITNNATITVLGLLSGASWQYQVDSTAGAWTAGIASSFTASSGGHTYFVRQFDSAGNTSIASVAAIYTLDTTPPTAPGITTPIAGDNTVSASEVSAGVTITGTAEANTSVTFTLYQVGKTVTANASGAWTATFDTIDWGRVGRGTHTLTTTTTDIAGNVGMTTATLTVANEVPLREIVLSNIAAGRGGGFALTGEAANDQSGYYKSVSAAGDVNGDGLADLLVGAPYNAAGGTNAGRSYVVFGKANTSAVSLSAVAAGTGGFAITGEAAYDDSGYSVSVAGDVNGDGLADLLVGAPGNDAGGSSAGRSYVVFGKANTSAVSLSAVAAGTGGFAITGEAASNYSGIAVSAAGDVNGDGLADLLVGAPVNGAGRSYVVFGKANTSAVSLSAVAAGTGGFAMTGEAADDGSGTSVSAAGDVNGDGLADLLVGAYGNDAGGDYAGRSYVVFGKANTSAVSLSAVAAGTGGFAITGEAIVDLSGSIVSAAGDVNGDGLADLLVGARGNNAYTGRSYVVFGKANTSAVSLSAVADGTGGFAITGEAADESGSSVSAAGDVNGDGLADLLVGAPYNAGGSRAGRSYVVYGTTNTSAVNLSAVAMGTGGFAITGEVTWDASGYSVSAAGDVNGDGLADLLVGAPYNDAGGSNAGRSYVIFGGTQWISTTVQGSGMVTGTSANEAIIGSSGVDTLTGGGGVDRFFAGAGNDVIVLTQSDISNLASNTPTAVTGGSVLSTVDGGTGIDTIRLTGGANLDLTTIKNTSGMNPKTTSRIASIERIDLATDTGANMLTLAVGDVIDMAGFNLFNTASGSGWTKSNDFTFTGFGTRSPYHQLVVDGTNLDTVVSAAGNGWVKQTGTVTSSFSGSSQTYNVYINTNKNAMLLIDTDITQTGVVV